MSDPVTVKAGQYDNIDGIHCGATRDFQVTCGGNTAVLAQDGDDFLFERHDITAKRDGEGVVFAKN